MADSHSHNHGSGCQHGHAHSHHPDDHVQAHDHSDSHSHGHGGHHHQHHHGASGNIRVAFFLNLSFSLIELVGGMMVGSLAIVADAIHDFGDSVSLGVAWFLEGYANRSKDQKFNFGYRRFSLLAALISGVVITTGSLVIIYESIQRFFEPRQTAGLHMAGLAVLGLAANGLAAWRLSRGETQNEKVLTWHLLEDVFGWAIVLLGGLIIHFTGWVWIDPVLAIGLAIFVSFNVVRYLKETAYLFLQGRPLNFDEPRFLADVMKIKGISHIDQLAIWSLDGESSVLSARLHLHSVRDPQEIEQVKAQVRTIAAQQKARATIETCLSETAKHDD